MCHYTSTSCFDIFFNKIFPHKHLEKCVSPLIAEVFFFESGFEQVEEACQSYLECFLSRLESLPLFVGKLDIFLPL